MQPFACHAALAFCLSWDLAAPDLVAGCESAFLLASPAGVDSAWETVAALPFVDNARSPPLFRAFYLPRLSPARNRHMEYVLLRQQPQQLEEQAGDRQQQ